MGQTSVLISLGLAHCLVKLNVFGLLCLWRTCWRFRRGGKWVVGEVYWEYWSMNAVRPSHPEISRVHMMVDQPGCRVHDGTTCSLLVTRAGRNRTQKQNRSQALHKLREMINEAWEPAKERKMRTGIGKKGKEIRKQEKLHRSKVGGCVSTPSPLCFDVVSPERARQVAKESLYASHLFIRTSPRLAVAWGVSFVCGPMCWLPSWPCSACPSIAVLLSSLKLWRPSIHRRYGIVLPSAARHPRSWLFLLGHQVHLLLCHDHILDDAEGR